MLPKEKLAQFTGKVRFMKSDEQLGLFKVMDRNGYLVRRLCLDKLNKDISKFLSQKNGPSVCFKKNQRKYKPYVEPPVKVEEAEIDLGKIGQFCLDKSIDESEEKEKNIGDTGKNFVIDKKTCEEIIEEKEYLLGPYLGQYVIFTSPIHAWLL